MRPAVKKYLTWLGLLLLFLAVMEVAARLDDWIRWDAPIFQNYSHLSLSVDNEHGRQGRPHGRFQKWQLNKLGLRGPEVPPARPGGPIRVLVLGASETFGLHEAPGGEFPALLQKILDLKAPGRYLVINAGFPGMSLPRLRFFFSRDYLALKPDIALIYPSPAFYLDLEPPRDPARHYFAVPRRPWFQSRLKGKAMILAKRLIPASWQTLMRRGLIYYRRMGGKKGFVWRTAPLGRVEIFARDLLALTSTIAESGTQVVLATHATRFGAGLSDEDRFHLYAWLLYFPRPEPQALLEMENLCNNRVRTIAKAFKLPLVDLAADLGGRAQMFADFSHFTDQGAEKAARLLAAEVLRLTQDGGPK